ncbi:MAG: hypothetical protein LAN63_00060 [Acidobacteriia bacterium]|nr:hypothetical protein [Terriglobia bacterium]
MAKYKKIAFIIDGYTPQTLPIGRLAEYLRNFAALVGPNSDVHFERVGRGSAALINRAPEDTALDVRGRISEAKEGHGPAEAVRGLAGLRTLLYEDNTTGRIKENRFKLLEFPKPRGPQYGPVMEEGTLEGVLIKIGGRDETVPVHLQDGDRYYKCVTTRAKAKELRNFLFDVPIRVFGKGKWIRTENGEWELSEFKIVDHEPLNDIELQQMIERLRKIPGSGWDKIADPLKELHRIREGGTNKVQ